MSAAGKIRALAAACAIATGMCASQTSAQVDESALTAAYIYNITQFTTWPQGALPDSQLVVCVDGQTPVGMELGKLGGKAAGRRAMTVVPLPASDKPSNCNVVVVDKDASVSSWLADYLASDRPVLIISNFDLGKRPWIVRLFTEDDHIRFDINRTEATRRRLSLSSRLLSLARSVL